MNIIDKIQSYFDILTNNEKEIAIFIINNTKDAARLTIDSLAKHTKTSKAAIVRFTQKIGYTGYTDFKYALSRFLISNNADAANNYQDSNALSIINTYVEHLNMMKDCIDLDELQALAKNILSANKRCLLGTSRSFTSTTQLQSRLLRIGFDSIALADKVLTMDMLEIMGCNDLVIIFTTGDNTQRYEEYVKTLNDHNCPVAIFTMNPNLRYRNLCKFYFVLPFISRGTSFTFLDDQALFFVFIEILLSEVAKLSNTTTKLTTPRPRNKHR